MTAWIYLLALLSTIAAVANGAGPYIGALFGFTSTTGTTIWRALALLLAETPINSRCRCR